MGEPLGSGASDGFAARCLLRKTCWATLATQSEGQPAATLVTHAVEPGGAVLMLLSGMAEHTRNLAGEPRCSLMVTGKPENLNWQTAPRLTLKGRAGLVTQNCLEARSYWVSHHPYASLYADFTDFAVWRLTPESGLFVAGFGRADRLVAAQMTCAASAVAALQAAQAALVAECNASHAAELGRLARHMGHPGNWVMLGVDPDGFDLVQDETMLRIAFDAPVQNAAEVRAALLRLFKAGRNGQVTG